MSVSDAVQIIDSEKEYHSEALKSLFSSDKSLLKSGFNYHVVSVFGSQSTGKSTLLNALFRTNFSVMSEASRQQTTKGIWLAEDHIPLQTKKCFEGENSEISHIFVMDVEGTDGRERGEDQEFERKAALFALATSEVLIINIWEHQVGLYHGANMALLKTVFEVNMNLFISHTSESKQSTRSLLLFVIRDHIGVTPVQNLANTLRTDIEKIWDGIPTSDSDKQYKLSDFFDLQFVALPHKLLQADEFAEGVANLCNRFVNKKLPDYIFKPEYHRNVPIDGWPFYANQVWDQISQSKDLDLPAQHILVSEFRCGEIFNEVWNDFVVSLEEINEDNLGEVAPNSYKTAINNFDINASRYSNDIYSTKREELLLKINEKMTSIFKTYFKLFESEAFSKFDSTLANSLSSSTKFAVTFVDALNDAELAARKLFKDKIVASNAHIAGIKNQFISDYMSNFDTELNNKVLKARHNQITRLLSKEEKIAKKEISQIVSSHLRNPFPYITLSKSTETNDIEKSHSESKRDDINNDKKDSSVSKLNLDRPDLKSSNVTENPRETEKSSLESSNSDLNLEKKITKKETVLLNSNLWDDIYESVEKVVLSSTKRLISNGNNPNSESIDTKTESKEFDLGVGATKKESEQAFTSLKNYCWQSYEAIVKETCRPETVYSIINEYFGMKFRYDENGVPRVWSDEKYSDGKEIDSLFRTSKKASILLLEYYEYPRLSNGDTFEPSFKNVELSYMNPEEDRNVDGEREPETVKGGKEYDNGNVFKRVLSPETVEEIRRKFSREADTAYVDAAQSARAAASAREAAFTASAAAAAYANANRRSLASVPYYFYLILLVLGWNEIMMVIRNPLTITLLIIFGAGFYIVNTLNLWGPLVMLSDQVLVHTKDYTVKRLREVLNEKPEEVDQKKSNESKYSENIELKDLSTNNDDSKS